MSPNLRGSTNLHAVGETVSTVKDAALSNTSTSTEIVFIKNYLNSAVEWVDQILFNHNRRSDDQNPNWNHISNDQWQPGPNGNETDHHRKLLPFEIDGALIVVMGCVFISCVGLAISFTRLVRYVFSEDISVQNLATVQAQKEKKETNIMFLCNDISRCVNAILRNLCLLCLGRKKKGFNLEADTEQSLYAKHTHPGGKNNKNRGPGRFDDDDEEENEYNRNHHNLHRFNPNIDPNDQEAMQRERDRLAGLLDKHTRGGEEQAGGMIVQVDRDLLAKEIRQEVRRQEKQQNNSGGLKAQKGLSHQQNRNRNNPSSGLHVSAEDTDGRMAHDLKEQILRDREERAARTGGVAAHLEVVNFADQTLESADKGQYRVVSGRGLSNERSGGYNDNQDYDNADDSLMNIHSSSGGGGGKKMNIPGSGSSSSKQKSGPGNRKRNNNDYDDEALLNSNYQDPVNGSNLKSKNEWVVVDIEKEKKLLKAQERNNSNDKSESKGRGPHGNKRLSSKDNNDNNDQGQLGTNHDQYRINKNLKPLKQQRAPPGKRGVGNKDALGLSGADFDDNGGGPPRKSPRGGGGNYLDVKKSPRPDGGPVGKKSPRLSGKPERSPRGRWWGVNYRGGGIGLRGEYVNNL